MRLSQLLARSRTSRATLLAKLAAARQRRLFVESLEDRRLLAIASVSHYADTSEDPSADPGAVYFSRDDVNVAVTFNYSLSGTATPGLDYTSGANGSVTVPAGEVGQRLEFAAIDDTLVEGTEYITVTITSVTGGFRLTKLAAPRTS